MSAYEIRTTNDFLLMIVERNIPLNDVKQLILNLSREVRYNLFETSDIHMIMASIPQLLRNFRNELSSNDGVYTVNKESLLEDIETSKHNLNYSKEEFEKCEFKIHLARKKSETNNDMDILFDCLDYVLPYKELWNLLINFSKKYYLILISMFHKKTNGLLQKIEEIRSLLYEQDEKMIRLLKINHELFNEQQYLKHSNYLKGIFKTLDNFVICINNGYKIE